VHLEGLALMAASGQPIAHEFLSASSPELVIRDVVLQADELERFGYRVESHAVDTATLVHRFTPTVAYAVPLTIAACGFVIGMTGTTQTAAAGGRVALIALIAAGVLSMLAKTTERVTFSAASEGDGSRVLVSGTATPAIRQWVLAAGDPPQVDPSPEILGET
jgi:hypothetical protein